ncbi:MAG: twin-arginine translocase subunit TatC [Candidatus Dormibacteria bacterium]
MSEPPLFMPPAPPPPPPADPDPARMTIIEHLEELRKVLIVSLAAWGICSVVGVALSGVLISLLVRPMARVGLQLHYFSLTGYPLIHLKVGVVAGFAIALPVVLGQVWSFVSPGLSDRERRFARPLLFSTLTLFAVGAGLAYFFLYIAVGFAEYFARHDPSLVLFPEANAYLGFVVILMLAFGITFEFPVALVLLASIGFIDAVKLSRWRKGAYFAICAVGYLVTPGVDPVTPLALILPLLLLYEGSILVIRRMKRK